MSALKMNTYVPIVILMPKSLDDRSMAQIYATYKDLMGYKEIHLDYSNTERVDSTFYPTLHAFKKTITDQKITYKSLNLHPTLKNQFVTHGTYSFLNLASGQKRSLLDVAFIQPFINATVTVLQVQTNIKASMLPPVLKPDESNQQNIEIAGVISIVSDAFMGTIAICFPKKTFLTICFNLFGEAQDEITADLEDTAGEILNMIFGTAKTELNKNKNYGIQKALPTIIRGTSLKLSQYTGTTVLLPFSSDAGDFHIEIELVSKD